jgi:LmbE family N-acetylglucosaminyl deacetylase
VLNELLQRLLIFVAHPDDEAIGCGILLQRAAEPLVAFATDGAPRDSYFWGRFDSREAYADLRGREATAALHEVGAPSPLFLDFAVDQELHLSLGRSLEALSDVVERWRPSAIVTHAYEGGHPDHDSCAFLAAQVAREYGLPVWEMPLYHRASGQTQAQCFIGGAPDVVLTATAEELKCKLRMAEAYESQRLTLATFDMTREQFRSQPAYDFDRPPHSGALNYEAWQWPMTGRELCAEFSEIVNRSLCRTDP